MYVVFLTTHAQWHHMIHKTKSVIITEYRNRKKKKLFTNVGRSRRTITGVIC